ncbi:hypothetical protein CBM2623_A210022 [Cupriavidus taiwanensis]|nr:hypothetical protein CBM2608_A200022 [Cupriavidus taiwanensis]SPA27164.1 hypothetical protein CBM2623_A210022 [Cupriavidus taiwanensis]
MPGEHGGAHGALAAHRPEYSKRRPLQKYASQPRASMTGHGDDSAGWRGRGHGAILADSAPAHRRRHPTSRRGSDD